MSKISKFSLFLFVLCFSSTLFSIYCYNKDASYYSYFSIDNQNFNILGIFLSNFTHANLIHLFMNFLFLYDICKLIKKHDFLSKHIIYLTLLSMFFTPIYSYILYSSYPTHVIAVGISGVLFSIFAFLLGFIFKNYKLIFGFLFLYHGIFIYFGVKIAWEIHLIGFIIGLTYRYFFVNHYKFEKVNLKKILDFKTPLGITFYEYLKIKNYSYLLNIPFEIKDKKFHYTQKDMDNFLSNSEIKDSDIEFFLESCLIDVYKNKKYFILEE